MASTAREDAEEAEEAFEEYVEKVGEEALVVAESAVVAPVELGFTLLAEFSALFTIIMIGVVWVLVWTATVYGKLFYSCQFCCDMSLIVSIQTHAGLLRHTYLI